MRALLCLPFLVAIACSGGSDDKSTPTTGATGETGTAVSGACDLFADLLNCTECSDGPYTCTFGETSATALSCGGCQAQAALYEQLCTDGSTADRATIEADTVCAPTVCVVAFDTCSDPCTPLCVTEADAEGLGDCDLGCTTPGAQPGTCAWQGSACGFDE